MNWDDFRFFLALARARTVSGAGRDLAVKHTTVARRISALEAKLATRLFERSTDGYVMTQAGENLYEHAALIEEQVQAADREVFGLDTQLQGELTLTGAQVTLNRLVIPHLDKFHELYPGIELQLSATVELEDLAARQADIALRLTPKPPDYLVGKKLLPLNQGIYGSSTYLNKHSKPQHIILWNDELEWPDWAKQHFADAKVVLRTNDVTSLLACVRNHMGLAQLPCYIGDSVTELRRLDLSLAPSDWSIWVLSHVDLRATARVRVCREFLIDIIQQQSRLIEGRDSRYHQ